MPIIVWDARGLAKRDTEEDGAQTVDALFTLVRAADNLFSRDIIRSRSPDEYGEEDK